MNREVRFVRRNRVDERATVGIAVAAAAVASASGACPTGYGLVDIVLVFVGVSFLTWASASAPWWTLGVISGIAAALSLDPVVSLIGFVGFACGLAIGLRREDQSGIRAVVGGIAANVLIRSELGGFLGLSAIVGITLGLALIVIGVRRRPRAIRKPAWIALGTVVGFGVIALLGLGIAGASARPDVAAGAASARSAIDLLSDGDYVAAADQFEAASDNFHEADRQLGGPLALPSRLVPAVAQNVRASNDLAAAAADALDDAALALRDVDVSGLRVIDGAIDVDAIRDTEGALLRVEAALKSLRTSVDDVRSPWLLERITQELDELDADLDAEEPRLQNAITAVRLAPDLLGDSGTRRYLILFTSPAEARGLGGFVGNYAEITISNGRVQVTDFNRRSELEEFIAENGAACATCPPEFLERYGRFGFDSGPDGGAAPRAWSNITMPAHFPYVAEAAATLYPQSGGHPIDGVIVMDPYVVAALMEYSGPIDLPELDVTVTAETAAQFILQDQYLLAFENDAASTDEENVERLDALETLGREVIVRLLSSSLPEPPQLADDLAPLVAERRLLVWTDRPDEQEFLDRIGLLGSIPSLDDADGGFSVSVTNASASKIDVFLEREVTVDVVEDEDGQRRLVADVTLRNNAPESGLPIYVIGNAVGIPTGSSRLFVSFYGPPTLQESTRDGEPVGLEPLSEAGWGAYGRYIDLASGEATTFRLEFSLTDADGGPSADAERSPTEFEQPLSERN